MYKYFNIPTNVGTCVSPGMSLQVKCIVETLSTEGAQVALDIAVTLQVAVQETL